MTADFSLTKPTQVKASPNRLFVSAKLGKYPVFQRYERIRYLLFHLSIYIFLPIFTLLKSTNKTLDGMLRNPAGQSLFP
jgi:hypothetical protein